MSTAPENELDLDKLFLPAWAQEPASKNLYARYEGEDRPERSERRGGGGGGRREQRGPRDRQRGPSGPRGPGGPANRAPGGNRPSGERRGGPRPGAPREKRGHHERPSRPTPPPLPEINLSLVADERGVDSLARQIKMSGRAYPLFEIAQMILQRPERLNAVFSVKKNAEGKPVQPLYLCALDDTLWLSEDEAVAHVLQKHFATFYQAERTATEPPKGKYTFVAQCGMSGIILGPPNYHDYQNQLRRLHAERFSRMPFDTYKARVKIVRDEEVVKKWVEDQSWKTEYVCLNLPEALKLPSPEAVEKHFRETHKENIIKPIETHTLGGSAARSLRSPDLVRLVRSVWDDQKRFPLQIATALSQQFAARGLQFFKVNRAITHVSVARPHYLDMEATPVSEGVKRIVDFINAHPKCTRRHLLDALAPAPAVIPVPSAAPPPANAPESPASPGSEPGSAAPVDPSATVAAPNPEQTAIIADLHWLIHQGHVIEFANGILETAKKPAPKPQKPAKPAEAPAEAATQAASEHPAAESAPGVAGTIETEDAQRHVEMEPGSVAEPLAGITTDVVRPGENSPETGETIEQPADATEHHVEQGASGGHPDSEGASESAADVKLESPS